MHLKPLIQRSFADSSTSKHSTPKLSIDLPAASSGFEKSHYNSRDPESKNESSHPFQAIASTPTVVHSLSRKQLDFCLGSLDRSARKSLSGPGFVCPNCNSGVWGSVCLRCKLKCESCHEQQTAHPSHLKIDIVVGSENESLRDNTDSILRLLFEASEVCGRCNSPRSASGACLRSEKVLLVFSQDGCLLWNS